MNVPIQDARQNLADLVDAAMGGKPSAITRYGKRRAVIVNVEWFEAHGGTFAGAEAQQAD